MTESERELLDRARRGDAPALEQLLADHEEQIYRFGLRMCGDPEDARDVLQETLLAAFRNLGDFRGDAALSTWLYQIARSFCIKLHRRDAGHPPPVEVDDARALPSADPRPDERTHAREIGEALGAALAALSPAHREVIVLRDVEGLSAEEAAGILGLDVGALKSRLHRARLELRQHLIDLLGDGGEPADPTLAGATPCPGLAHELAAYAAADIDQATCRRIEEHLAACTRCRGACDALRRTVSLCRRIPGDEVPPTVRAAVRQALRSLSAA